MATQQMQQMQMSTPTPQATYMNNKTWVSGEAGAKAYLVAPSSEIGRYPQDMTQQKMGAKSKA